MSSLITVVICQILCHKGGSKKIAWDRVAGVLYQYQVVSTTDRFELPFSLLILWYNKYIK